MQDYYLSIPLYHVDSKENNEHFIAGHKIPESMEDGDWGGKGLYFWDNIENAKYWKKTHWKENAYKASIVKTLFKIKDDDLLDLTEPNNVKIFEKSLQSINIRAQQSREMDIKNKSDYILKGVSKGYAINYYYRYLKEAYNHTFKSVKIVGLYPSVHTSDLFRDDLVLNKEYNKTSKRNLTQKHFMPHVTIQSKTIYVVRKQDLLSKRIVLQEED